MKYVKVKVDSNDADYLETTQIVQDADIPILKKVGEAIKNFNSTHPRGHGDYNWPRSEYRDSTPEETYEGILTEDDIQCMDDYCPYGEYGFHTIEEIKIFEITNLDKIL